jgi:choice-of-anchor C domain-containing protein
MLGATSAQASSILINGSFEQGTDPGSFTTLPGGSSGLQGWSIFGAGVDYIGTYWRASDGQRSLDLSALAAGGIQQNLATTVGGKYQVSFDVAGNPGDNNTNPVKTLYYSVFGVGLMNEYTTTFDTTHTSTANMGWQTIAFSFIATSPTTSLVFSSFTNSAYGPALDNVSVNAVSPVPLPGALPLFGAGLAGLGAVARRRRKGG